MEDATEILIDIGPVQMPPKPHPATPPDQAWRALAALHGH